MAARVLEGGSGEAVNVGVGYAKFRHAFGDAEAVVELVDKVTKAVKAAVYAQITGYLVEARLNGGAVELEDCGHADGVSGAMMSVVYGSERMAEGVDGAEAFLKGGGAHSGGAHHVGAGFDVGAVLVGAREVVDDQFHAFDGDALAHGMVVRAGEGFDAMGKGVEPGTSSDSGRHTDCELRIANDYRRQDFGVEDDLFLLALRVGYDAGAPDFGAGASGGGDGDYGSDGVGVCTRPPIANVFKVPDWPRLTRHEGDHFAEVESRAATKGNDAIVTAVFVGCYSGGEVVLVGIRVDVAKDGAPQASARHEV